MAIQKEKVSQKLTEIRAQHDLSQERAAARVGVTMRQWQRWESGASLPYTRNLDAIAEVFSIPVAEFFDDEDERGAPAVAPPGQLDRLEQNQNMIMRNQEQIIRLLRQLIPEPSAVPPLRREELLDDIPPESDQPARGRKRRAG